MQGRVARSLLSLAAGFGQDVGGGRILVRQKITRQNDFQQAGERFRAFEAWERDELISNLVDALKDCPREIQERAVSNFTKADADYGRRVAEGIGLAAAASSGNGENGAKAKAAKPMVGLVWLIGGISKMI